MMKTTETRQVQVLRYTDGRMTDTGDILAAEEPLEISIRRSGDKQEAKSISVTMRTPGNDAELALGFLYTEGILSGPEDFIHAETTAENKTEILLRKGVDFDEQKLQRHFYTSSSCGVCGKSSIESLMHTRPGKVSCSISVKPDLLFSLDPKVRETQRIFESTGGLHASALFSADGTLSALYEDVGRHNALDKLIGSYLIKGCLPPADSLLFLSGRACYELIQKAAAAGIGFVCALGAPSSLAVELALACNMTLIGFLKKDTFNVYSGPERIAQ